MGKISPFAPKHLPHLPPIEGVRMATAAAGIRYPGRVDLLFALFDPGTSVAGALTTSKTASAPVDWCRERLAHGMARALVVNSGNANAFTGRRGREAVKLTAEAAAAAANCLEADVYVASTGVIGEPLDASKIAAKLGDLADQAKPDAYEAAARAIMTTDTFPKLATRKAEIDGVEVTINGIAKGAGMIAPDMATMLAFLFTDAAIEPGALRDCLHPALDESFNAITIDGDTSTSDTLLVFATGRAIARGAPHIAYGEDPRLAAFRIAVAQVMHDLALQVVKDGEGLTKFVTVRVTGAESKEAARTIAKSIANSPLVKTAIAGEDPNWGRIVAAVGKAGERAERDLLAIRLGEILVAKDGEVAPGYSEAQGAAYMKGSEIAITVDVGVGSGAATVWTCDLTKEYIAINADYRS
ncbi:bifunctional glutamate N-acetyltransferase/amino-acid acetyltransferase ArgJ [Methyloceanibacter sp.]|uniref:bifunctional glutamate N-acetyltransferase/amino-acid acetyltransferase ArgJ n=1 Tax=Methyloceanibacter sp. TaxID=1965321 RepID=UPI002D535674|nr:bifunctional glutamate N-acetyltransferase/amino-acid acetyltransferase ArgJ [Methyloceanibacter sp.]HZP09113.1 bifunctional glutamate N-acetyltransferase/amino-acid acetyltransferase ArgJ [Methyloceanibacter sp.]